MIFDWFLIFVEGILRGVFSVLPDMAIMPEWWGFTWIFLADSFASMLYLFPDELHFHMLFVMQSILLTEIAIFGFMLYEKVIRFFRG